LACTPLAAEVDDFLARATKQRWSPRQILEHLTQAEAAERAHRSLERRLRLSEIKKFKPMANFDWSWPTKIERDVMERALTLDFLAEARNLILMGANGLGKTMIAQHICHAAVLAGHSVLFRSAAACWKSCIVRLPKAATASCAPMPMWAYFASMRLVTCPSMTSPPTYSTKSSTDVTNENP
jgi:hypothetical protein